MALVMTLTDGTNTVTLTSTDAYCLSFGLETPSVSAETASDNHEIEFFGGNSTVATNLAKMGRLLEQAVRWQKTRVGPRVFITYQIDGTNTHRGEVVDGAWQPTPEMVNYERSNGIQKGILTIVRRNWLERAEVTATITSANSDKKTYNDGAYTGTSPTKHVNYWDVNATAIDGDLPAPTRMLLGISQVYGAGGAAVISVARSNAQLANLAAEAGWWESGSGWSANADANRTNSDYETRTLSSDPQNLIFTANWYNYINSFGGDVGFYRVFAYMKLDAAKTCKVTPYVLDANLAVRYGKSLYVAMMTSYQLIDCGGLYIPATYSNKRAMGATDIGLQISNANGNVITVDWVHVFRADGWKKYYIPDFGAGSFVNLEDDQIDGSAVYAAHSSGSRLGDIAVEGAASAFQLIPGKWHRFYMHAYTSYAIPKDTNIVPAITYRPRFLTLA